MIAVTGATGNIGSKLTRILLDKGEKVLCIARHADKLIPFTDRGAGAVAISLAQTDLLAEAFYGAEAVFAMIPPNYAAPDFLAYQDMIGTSLVEAIEQSGVKNVVNLSSLGADLPDKTGPIKGLRAQELRLNRLKGVNVLHLQPAYFMENLLVNADLIKTQNIMGSALRSDLQMHMVATRDIAAVAAQHLQKRDFAGKSVVQLLGRSDLTMDEATAIIGRKIDKPDLRYVQFSYEDTEKALAGIGFSADAVKLFIEMSRAFNEGLIKGIRTKENTTGTAFEEFAQIFRSLAGGR
ncbi:MAG: NAD-dependent epimerase/dehydratase family protein [Desulfobacteraceae bacterium]|nr:MAG: NAD-dependent epimerase/dehydratase family protein [Desulfobacteraceae bacterium]